MAATQHSWDVWARESRLDPLLRTELQQLMTQGATSDLEDRFGRDLEFGTGGLRAKMGVGTNRMNVHTVRRATYGVAKWILESAADQPMRLVICYDGRHHSREFAQESARVATALGVTTFVFPEPRPTPLLSFAVRHLQCTAGIMITASHNPPEYNGYKLYGSDGGQVLPDVADRVVKHMSDVADLFDVPVKSVDTARAEGLLCDVDPEVERAYYQAVAPLYGSAPGKGELVIAYTPLHGTGATMVPVALRNAGFTQVHLVEAQSVLDANFTHVKSPNPEEAAAYDLAIETAKAVQADIIMATDPDTDRVGVMARDAQGEYVLFSGNDIGGLLLDDYLQTKPLPANPVMVTTNVTSDFGEAVASTRGVRTERVLTGFKYIGERIGHYERTGEATFVFGYEESVGYLAMPFVRDKDAVQAALLVANMAARHKAAGHTLLTARDALFATHGTFRDRLLGYTFPGLSGVETMQQLMAHVREHPITVEGMDCLTVEDCLLQQRFDVHKGTVEPTGLPVSDVIKYRFAGGSWIAIRPSGTEPKLKVYLGARGDDEVAASATITRLFDAVDRLVQSYL